MSANVSSLSQVAHFEGNKKITIGNGANMSIKSIGSTTLKTKDHSLILNNVLYVPHIARSLLSVKQLCADNKSWFIYDESNFFVQGKKTREVLYQRTVSNSSS